MLFRSLGGLLVKAILHYADEFDAGDSFEKSRKLIATTTKAVMFLATPHQGSSYADLFSKLKIFGPTVNISDLKTNNPYLDEYYDWYSCVYTRRYDVETYSYFESRSLEIKGFWKNLIYKPYQLLRIIFLNKWKDVIVDERSARPCAGRKIVTLDEDHVTIAKPKNKQEIVYKQLSDLINTIVIAEKISSKDILSIFEQLLDAFDNAVDNLNKPRTSWANFKLVMNSDSKKFEVKELLKEWNRLEDDDNAKNILAQYKMLDMEYEYGDTPNFRKKAIEEIIKWQKYLKVHMSQSSQK